MKKSGDRYVGRRCSFFRVPPAGRGCTTGQSVGVSFLRRFFGGFGGCAAM